MSELKGNNLQSVETYSATISLNQIMKSVVSAENQGGGDDSFQSFKGLIWTKNGRRGRIEMSRLVQAQVIKFTELQYKLSNNQPK